MTTGKNNTHAPKRLTTAEYIKLAHKWQEYSENPALTTQQRYDATTQRNMSMQTVALIDRLYETHRHIAEKQGQRFLELNTQLRLMLETPAPEVPATIDAKRQEGKTTSKVGN